MRAKPKAKAAGRQSFVPLQADRNRRGSSPSRTASPADSRRAAGSPRSPRSPRTTLASKLKEEFKEFDDDKTGTINREDLQDVLLKLNPSLAAKDLDRFLRVADKKGNGIIDYQAFVDFLMYVENPSARPLAANYTGDVVNPTTGSAVNVFASMPSIAKQQGLDELPAADENITFDELLEIQKLHRPPAVVQRVLEATCMLLDAKRYPRPRVLGWDAVRKRIIEDGFLEEMVAFDCADLIATPGLVRFVITNYFKPKDKEVLTFNRVQYANQAAANLWKWCGSMVLQASKALEPANGALELDPPQEPLVPDESTPPPSPKEKPRPPDPVPPREPTPPPPPKEGPRPPDPEPPTEPTSPPTVPKEGQRPPDPEPPKEPPRPPSPKEPNPPPSPRVPSRPPTPKGPSPPPTPRPPSPTPSEIALSTLPLNDAERWHLGFRQDAGLCPDGWPQDSDCVVCLIFAHFQFRREAGVCPEGFDRDEQCKTCSMFVGLNKMFNGVSIVGLENVRDTV